MNYFHLGPGEIRLLTIYPSQYPKAAVRCHLRHELLESAVYEALSYVWGSSSSTGMILVDEEEVTVTPNLLAALRCLRGIENERVLWVDAICINQKDDREKSTQVQAMGSIFSKATVVNCWLGETGEESDRAMEVVREMASACGNLSKRDSRNDKLQYLVRARDFCQKYTQFSGSFYIFLYREFWLRIGQHSRWLWLGARSSIVGTSLQDGLSSQTCTCFYKPTHRMELLI